MGCMTCCNCHSGKIVYSKWLKSSICAECGSSNIAWDEEFGGYDEERSGSELGKSNKGEGE